MYTLCSKFKTYLRLTLVCNLVCFIIMYFEHDFFLILALNKNEYGIQYIFIFQPIFFI